MGDVEIRVATDDDFEPMVRLDGLAFGWTWPPEQHETLRELIDLDRFRVAVDAGRIVGVAGAYTQEVTVPGGALVPNGGVTWVAVAPTHSRRGILRRLMAELHRDVDARGEPIAMLTASEGGIYERFGYGVACHLRVVEIDRRRAQLRPEFRPEPGSVQPVDPDDPRLPEIFDRYRRTRVGEIGRSPVDERLFRLHEGAGLTGAIHADGFALWKLEAKWNRGHPAHQLTLHDVVALTPEAHAALWHTVLSVGLVGPITSYRAVAL
ncbi:MAG: GNAT family N-acetyltransferase, partial [Ilumatobacter sp.]|nr:GNAT family N-acetyltransferase [Ilumatobacter sp.]